jgi:hypothetical protein
VDPAEEIVGEWLQSKGFFVMSDIPCGARKQIDFLAFNPKTGEKTHVEVHVSTKPAHPLRGGSDQEYGKRPQRLKEFYLSKFVGRMDHKKEGEALDDSVEKMAKEALASDRYQKWLVVGKLKVEDDKERLEADHGLRIFFFEDVFREVLQKRGTRASEILRYAVEHYKQ